MSSAPSKGKPPILNAPSTPNKSTNVPSTTSSLPSTSQAKLLPMSQLFSRTSNNAIQVAMDSPVPDGTSMAPRMWQSDFSISPTMLLHHSKQDARIDAAVEKSELTGLDMSGVRIRRFPEELCRFGFLAELRLDNNLLQNIPPSICQLRCLLYLDFSNNQLQSIPEEMGKLANLRELLLYNNHITTLPSELGFLYNLEVLGLDGNPIMDPALLPYIQHQNSISIIPFLRDHVMNIEPPADRLWHPVESASTIPPNVAGTFTLLSYNILAEKYASPQMYGYVPSWYLPWEYRKLQIIQEILSYDPDIICLQEVETSQFEQFFRPNLRMHGYEGIFSPKSRAKTMTEWDRTFVDGCAIFYKFDQFKLEEKHNLIEFNQTALARPSLRKHKDVYNRVMTRDNIAIVARLEHIKTRRPVLIGNCHIHWDPQYRDVKLLQTVMLCEEMERLADRLPPSGALVLCGDFNAMPDSGVYEYLSHGNISPQHPDFMSHTYEPYTTDGARHHLNLRSAYSLLTYDTEVESGANPFTNFTPNFCGTIDYIWYRPTTLSITGLLGSLPADYVKQLVGMPTQHFPSDHVSLLAEFKFEPAPPPPPLYTIKPSVMPNIVPSNVHNIYGGSTIQSSESQSRRMYSRNKSVLS